MPIHHIHHIRHHRGFMRGVLILLVALVLGGCDNPWRGSGFHGTVVSLTDGGARFGRDFSLQDMHGQSRHLADYRGKVVVLFFGYTQCPDVCPTTLTTLADTLRQLGPEAARVQVLFITLDPARDTPALLAAYVPQFNPAFVGLTGDLHAIADTAREFQVIYQKRPGSTPGSYSMDHSTYSYLYDPQGRLRLIEKYGETPAHLAADIRQLLAGK